MTSRIDIRRVFEQPAPCDNCIKRYICEEQELACRAFSGYVVTGKAYEHSARIPDRHIFYKIFKEDDSLILTKFLQSLNATQGELPL